MRRALLVAAREYRQITATRGFWVMLMVIPLAIAVTQFAGRMIRPETNVAYVLADASGRYGPAIQHRLELDYQRRVMSSLATYVQRWKLAAAGAAWASGPRWFSDAEVEAFMAGGGLPAALRRIAPRLPPDAPAFTAPPHAVLPAEATLAPADQGPTAFGDAIAARLQGDVATAEGRRPLALAIYIPSDFGTSGAPARIWTNGPPNDVLIGIVRTELTGALRTQALSQAGLAPAAFARIEAVSAPLTVTAPAPGRGRAFIAERSILPLAMVYLLLVTVMITGTMMLQGLIEERSNKLVESVLACIRPEELMYGKLLGLGAVGLTTVIVWAGCAAGAALAMQGAVADFLRPSLQSFAHPWIAAALIFYFLAGYLVVSMLYLAIGSLSDSMQDAQAYLVPVVMVIMLPIVFMMLAVVQAPNGFLPRLLSWIPLYTPFAMLARLGSGVSIAEVLGTSALLIAFIALEVVLLGRLFKVSLLRTGQPPGLAALAGLILGTQAD